MNAQNLPFSKFRHVDGLTFLAGEVALGADGQVPAGITAQTKLVIERIAQTLDACGSSLGQVVQVVVHLVDASDFAAFNAEYLRHFEDPLPVRTTVVAGLLVPGALIEITVTASQGR